MAKDLKLNVTKDDVVYSGISKSKNGYNSATVGVKRGENEYMTISYEWAGDNIPDFVMDLMGFMQAHKVETSGIWPGKEEAYEEYSKCGGGKKGGGKKGKKKMKDEEDAAKKGKEKFCPKCKKPMSKCECEDEDDMEDE